jgi:phosphoribosylamine--glycine ligase
VRRAIPVPRTKPQPPFPPTIWTDSPTRRTPHGIDLTVIGPECRSRGLADQLQAEGRAVFRPGAAAAQIEASKAFAKEVMAAVGIHASSHTFDKLGAAMTYVADHPEPLVVKASGLAGRVR